MNSKRFWLGVVVALVLVAVAAAAFIWFSGGSGEASQAIDAPTLDAAASDAEGSATTFNIIPEESEGRLLLDEDLRGQRVTVVGVTNQVAGQLAVDFAAPANSVVGVIRINVRTLATDNEFRNRAIRGQILQSQNDEFEFAQFTPTAISGLPETLTIGEPITFQITGDLLIRDVSQPVTFETTVTPVSETRLEGQARAVIQRGDYGLTIPSVPGVANVEEEVELEIDFAATAA